MRALLLTLLLPVALAGSSSVGVSSPLLLWSSRGVLGGGKGQHVSYQVVPDVEEVASSFVLKALGKAADAASGPLTDLVKSGSVEGEQQTVVVFIGSQLDVTDMRSRASPASQLEPVLSSAASSLVVPYATSQGASILETVCSKLDTAGVKHQTVGCSAPSTDLQSDVAAALAAAAESPLSTVLVCSHVAPEAAGRPAGLQAELEQLAAVRAAVDAAGDAAGSPLFMYASQAEATRGSQRSLLALEGGARRGLAAADNSTTPPDYWGFGPYKNCGKLCQTQVRWLEGMLAALVLALATCAGLVCLNVLDTPTRFESPKDAAGQQ